MADTALVIGLGDLGTRVLDSLARLPELERLVGASRDEEHGRARAAQAALEAELLGGPRHVEFDAGSGEANRIPAGPSAGRGRVRRHRRVREGRPHGVRGRRGSQVVRVPPARQRIGRAEQLPDALVVEPLASDSHLRRPRRLPRVTQGLM